MSNLLFKDEAFRIIGACMEVHKNLGCGFLESVYQEALEIELSLCNIPFEKEKPLNIFYKNNQLDRHYRVDFVCFGKIILELKALISLKTEHIGQILNYLKATNFQLGMLVNFGESSLKFKRVVNEYYFNKS